MLRTHLLSLLAVACCFAPLSSQAQELALTPMPQTTVPKWWKDRSDLLNTRAKEGGFDVMFIGDSITQGWEGAGKKVWEEKIAPLKAANFGISGDRVEQVLWRLQNGNLSENAKPKVAVLMVGTNNTGHRREKPEMIAAGVKAIIGEIQKRKPDTKILVLAIFPRGAKTEDALR
ncbi:MAG: GDSL-type esterase/lipase family protein, partial [Puniceicoccales bacterium]|nr:GDSL-type esterase/lipase family protein [Puniceicoccales bacterium]